MPKIYKKLTTDFTVISNEIFKHKLSFKAIGLYVYIAQKPDDWDFSMLRVANQSGDGETIVRSAIKELEEAGFLERRMKYFNGKIRGYDWYIYDKPDQSVENQPIEKQSVGNPPVEKPPVENPPTLVSTKEVNTKLVNTKEENVRANALAPIKKEVLYKLLEDVGETQFQQIAEHYQVPLSFVLSKYEDMVLWAGQQPNSGKLKGRNWKLTLMNWVKRDAQKIMERRVQNNVRPSIDARGLSGKI